MRNHHGLHLLNKAVCGILKLKKLAEKWKITVIGGQALGDASIVEVVNIIQI